MLKQTAKHAVCNNEHFSERFMIFKRSVCFILSLFIVLSSYGCIALLSSVFMEESTSDEDVTEAFLHTASDPEDNKTPEPVDEIDLYIDNTENSEDFKTEEPTNPHELDMSSAEAFIADVKNTYGIDLIDRHDYLKSPDGDRMMHDLSYTLSLFSPLFINTLVDEYKEYDSAFLIYLEGPSRTEYGMTVWDRDLIITLHYDRYPDECGISAPVLAHEMAHAVHFIIEEYIDETRSMLELRFFNGAHDYVGDAYEHAWDPDVHGFYFAYDYGMYDYYEDFATVIEMLVAFPVDMCDRFSDGYHDPLMRKTAYLRDLMSYYISENGIFTPLYDAEMS